MAGPSSPCRRRHESWLVVPAVLSLALAAQPWAAFTTGLARRPPCRASWRCGRAAADRAADGADAGPRKLFPVLVVGNRSQVKPTAAKLSYMLDKERVVDLVLVGGEEQRARLMFILAYALTKTQGDKKRAVLVLPRQRDARCRLRVVDDFSAGEDTGSAKTLRVASRTDPTKLAWAMKSELMSPEGKLLAPTVRLSALRSPPASIALKAIEQLYWDMRRDLAFVPVWAKIPANESAGASADGEPGDTALVVSVSMV
mmetsp:Transcript_12872/g.29204  ORF Transcript_12872/g.29204 Transcript_12872/m.29204 type:complete len:257 (-) Transcript_12872:100-870(-)